MGAWVRDQGHEFEFEGSPVHVDAVFLDATYAPAILAVADAERAQREIPWDLGVEFVAEPESLFGSRVVFVEERNGVAAQIFRLALTMLVVEALPRSGRAIQLDRLQLVWRDRLRMSGEARAAEGDQ